MGRPEGAIELHAAIGRRPELLPQLVRLQSDTVNTITRHARFHDFENREIDRALLALGLVEQAYQAGEVMARMTPPPSHPG